MPKCSSLLAIAKPLFQSTPHPPTANSIARIWLMNNEQWLIEYILQLRVDYNSLKSGIIDERQNPTSRISSLLCVAYFVPTFERLLLCSRFWGERQSNPLAVICTK
ncbi:hypothetical protein BLOT_012993 [Blomia tropicalis]|nr:hypothetical protein BLOT_012993 [Blomia tropicalis]